MIKENWNSKSSYNEFMGKWSSQVAKKFLEWLNKETDIKNKKWIDVGCGTGALTDAIVKSTTPKFVLGIDPSPDYLPSSTSDKISFKLGSSTQLPAESGFFDFVLSGLALNFMPDKNASIQEMLRVLKPNGYISLYVWDYAEQMEFLRYFWDSAKELKPEAEDLDEGVIFPICRKPALKLLFEKNGLKEIKTHDLIIDTKFADFDSYWNPFFGGQGPSGSFLLSLSEDDKESLKKLLQSKIPTQKGGNIFLKARAFAIQGKKTF